MANAGIVIVTASSEVELSEVELILEDTIALPDFPNIDQVLRRILEARPITLTLPEHDDMIRAMFSDNGKAWSYLWEQQFVARTAPFCAQPRHGGHLLAAWAVLGEYMLRVRFNYQDSFGREGSSQYMIPRSEIGGQE